MFMIIPLISHPVALIVQPPGYSANYHFKTTKKCFNRIFIFLLPVLSPQYLPKQQRFLQISPLTKGTISASPAQQRVDQSLQLPGDTSPPKVREQFGVLCHEELGELLVMALVTLFKGFYIFQFEINVLRILQETLVFSERQAYPLRFQQSSQRISPTLGTKSQLFCGCNGGKMVWKNFTGRI